MSTDNHHAPVVRRREWARIAIATAVAVAALVYVVTNLNETVPGALSRLAAAVSLILIFQWLIERRMTRKIDRIERLLDERLERQRQWKAYSAALDDLSGIGGDASGEHSGDIYGGRRH